MLYVIQLVSLINISFFHIPAEPVLIDLVNYNKLVGFRTINALAIENKIDTVYVRYAYETEDRYFDCNKPSHMLELKYIIGIRDPKVVGWRLHHHHREENCLAAANAAYAMKVNEE